MAMDPTVAMALIGAAAKGSQMPGDYFAWKRMRKEHPDRIMLGHWSGKEAVDPGRAPSMPSYLLEGASAGLGGAQSLSGINQQNAIADYNRGGGQPGVAEGLAAAKIGSTPVATQGMGLSPWDSGGGQNRAKADQYSGSGENPWLIGKSLQYDPYAW